MKKIYLLFLYLLYNIILLKGQSPELPSNLPSPNVQSFIEYGNHNVDLYNGRPNISVPIYSLNYFDIPLDVSLSYSSKAVQVNDIPGWTGLNWNLNAGGVIYRSKKEHLDERDDYRLGGGQNFPTDGFFKAYNLLDNSNWLNPNFIENLILSSEDGGDGFKRQFRTDYHPDIFHFNFMGFSGKFFMGNDGNFKIQSEQNLKIDIKKEEYKYPFNKEKIPFNNFGYKGFAQSEVAQLKQIFKITITDQQGNQYIFGNDLNNIEYSTGFFTQLFNSQWDADSWYLSEVKNRFGKLIYKFHYDRIEYISKFYKSYSINEKKARGKISGTWLNCGSATISPNDFQGRLISPVYLNKIETLDGDIIFSKNLSYARNYKAEDVNFLDYLLEKSTIQNGNHTVSPNYVYLLSSTESSNQAHLINSQKFQKLVTINGLGKSIKFNYDGEIQNDQYQNSKRLTLSSLEINNQKFSFDYYKNEQLPSFLSLTTDHWGNYNGIQKTTSSLQESSFTNFSITRKLDTDKVKYGLLTKITYPTKGFTIYDWEPNSYKSYLSDDKKTLINIDNEEYGGGVRIKSINDYDISGELKTKRFLYGTNNITSGILENQPTYIWKDFQIKGSSKDNLTATLNTYSNNPLFSLSNYSGTSVNYSNVTEIFSDNSSIENKFTSNLDINYRDQIIIYEANSNISPYVSLSDRSHLRGKDLETIFYDSKKNRKKYIKYNYNLPDESQYVKALTFEQWQCPSFATYFLFVKPVKLFYNELELKSIYNEENTSNGILKTETNYYYIANEKYNNNGFKKYLRKEELVLNKLANETKSKEFFYSFDGDEIQRSNYNNLNINNIISTKESSSNSLDGLNVLSIKSFESKKFQDNSQSYLPYIYKVSKGNDNAVSTQIIDSYETSTTRVNQHHLDNSGIYTTYFYYNDKVLATIIGDKINLPSNEFNTIKSNLNKLIINFSDWKNKRDLILEELNSLRDTYPNHMITTYVHQPLSGISAQTFQNGISEFYNYDEFGRLEEIRNHNNELIKKFEYNYSKMKEVFYNTQIEFTTYKNCLSNQFSKPTIYTIPPYKYHSTISIADANEKARKQEEVNSSNYANNNGLCENNNCKIDLNSLLEYPHGPTLSVSNIIKNNVDIAITFKATPLILASETWESNGYYIGKINGLCIPKTNKVITQYIDGKMIYLTSYINTNGELRIKASPKKNIEPNSYILIRTSYDVFN